METQLEMEMEMRWKRKWKLNRNETELEWKWKWNGRYGSPGTEMGMELEIEQTCMYIYIEWTEMGIKSARKYVKNEGPSNPKAILCKTAPI